MLYNRDDVNDDTLTITAAQQSQAAVLAVDSAVEKYRAVTERKHFPLNLNKPGFVVFSVSYVLARQLEAVKKGAAKQSRISDSITEYDW